MPRESTVYVVDDDPGILKSMRWLIESARLPVKTFDSGATFLECYDSDDPGCLILDMQMPGMKGLEVQRRLAELCARLPIIVMTAHADVPVCIESFKSGVFDFIEKPADDGLLLARIRQALALDQENRRLDGARHALAARLSELSPRERQVMHLVADGRNLKQIALGLDISIQTAAKHRARMLEKIGADNDVKLARMVTQAGAMQATFVQLASLPTPTPIAGSL